MKANLEITEENTDIKESAQEDSGELSMYDNHPADMGTALFEREKDLALHVHAGSELQKVEEALLKITSDTYGICETCHKPIPFERLEAVPYTTVCIEHAKIKEEMAEDKSPSYSIENPFKQTQDGRVPDYENSFEEVAEFGTSDSPSDFTNSENPTYFNESDDNTSLIDDIVGDSVTDNTTKS